MRVAVTYSTKEGLREEYKKHSKGESFSDSEDEPPPTDSFAEGDSEETINAVLCALRSGGHKVYGIEADDYAAGRLYGFKPDIVFNIAEGLFGDFRESYIPVICERLGFPYSGSDPLTLAICLNKARTKEILTCYSVPNAFFRIFHTSNDIHGLDDFNYPAIIKPVAEGSSKGIFEDSVVDDPKSAKKRISEKIRKYHQPVIMENFLEGDEFTVAVWGNGSEMEVLPIVSISYGELPEKSRKIYSYEAKWIWDTPEKPLNIFQCPAKITLKLRKDIEKTVKKACMILGVRDWCRVDVRCDSKGVPNILELNPLPGILPNPEDNSCFPKAARTRGCTYDEMINRVLKIAADRNDLSI